MTPFDALTYIATHDLETTTAGNNEHEALHDLIAVAQGALREMQKEQRFHIIYTSDYGPQHISFDCEDDRAKWCSTQDATFESYIAVDGFVDNVYTPIIGE